MTAKFMDSFDHYSNPSQKWYATNRASILTGLGRFGTNGCSLLSGGYLGYYRPLLQNNWTETYENGSEWIIGFALKRTLAVSEDLLSFCLTPDLSTSQVTISVLSDGSFFSDLESVSGPSDLTTSLKMSLNEWYYVEVYVLSDPFFGTVTIRVNGTEWVSKINVITGGLDESPFHYINAIYLQGSGSPYIDDVYILSINGNDPQGSSHNNTFWGDTRIEVMHPEADGFYQDWTPSSGSEGWRMVNSVYDQYTDNVYTYPTYDRETFVMDSLIALPGTVNAVQQSVLLKQSNWLEPLIYTSGSPYYLTSGSYRVAFGVNTSPIYGTAMWQVDPSTLLGWDDVNLPAAEFGFMSTTTSGSL